VVVVVMLFRRCCFGDVVVVVEMVRRCCLGDDVCYGEGGEEMLAVVVEVAWLLRCGCGC